MSEYTQYKLKISGKNKPFFELTGKNEQIKSDGLSDYHDVIALRNLFFTEPEEDEKEILGLLESKIKGIPLRHHRGQSTQFARALGSVVYENIFPEPIRKAMKRIPPDSFLHFELEDNYETLPWELAYDGENFLCLKYAIGRTASDTPKSWVKGEKLDMLMVGDPTGDLYGAQQETNYILTQLRGFRQLRIMRYGPEILKRDFLVLYSSGSFELIHYSGHSQADPSDPRKSCLIFRDSPCYGSEIIDKSPKSPLFFVFLNSCESGGVSYLSQETGNPSLAGLFLKAGAKGCIASLWLVSDIPSANFSSDFYRFLLFGSSTGQAMLRARRNSFRRWGFNDFIWASFLLYGDPTMNLLLDR